MKSAAVIKRICPACKGSGVFYVKSTMQAKIRALTERSEIQFNRVIACDTCDNTGRLDPPDAAPCP